MNNNNSDDNRDDDDDDIDDDWWWWWCIKDDDDNDNGLFIKLWKESHLRILTEHDKERLTIYAANQYTVKEWSYSLATIFNTL